MTRGRKPAVTIDEAAARCSGEGAAVLPITGSRACADLIVFSGKMVRLIRVRRPHNAIGSVDSVAFRYSKEIARLRNFPVPDTVTKELMVREPGGSWRTFRVLPHRIEEVRE